MTFKRTYSAGAKLFLRLHKQWAAVLLPLILALLASRNAFSQLRTASFESTMRAFQERRCYGWDGNNGGNGPSDKITWPNAGDGTNPGPFPEDGYYEAHKGTGSVSVPFNDALYSMKTRLDDVAALFITDPYWLEGKSTDVGPTATLAAQLGPDYFASLSSKTAFELLREINFVLRQCVWTTNILWAGGGIGGYERKLTSSVTADPQYSTGSAAWGAVQNLTGNGTSYMISGSVGLKSGSNPPAWGASQAGMDVDFFAKKGAGLVWFAKAVGGNPAGNLNLMASDGVYRKFTEDAKFRIVLPPEIIQNGGGRFADLQISNHKAYQPSFTHYPGGSPPKEPNPCDPASINSAHFQWDMGTTEAGETQGVIKLYHKTSTFAWYSPNHLNSTTSNGFKRVFDSNNNLLQAYGPTVVVDVAAVTALGYELRFFHRQNSWQPGSNGVITTSGTPYLVASVANPDTTGATYNRLRITETRGTSSKWWEFQFTAATQEWKLSSSEEAEIKTLTETTPDANSEWTKNRITKLADGTVLSHTRETHKRFAWGEELIQSVDDPNGVARTTSWVFSVTDGPASYGKVKQKVLPSGAWEKYSYDSLRRLKKVVRTYLDTSLNAAESQCRVTEYTYPSDFSPATDYTMIVEKIQGVEVARRYRREYWDGYDEVVAQTQGAAITATDNLVTKYRYYLDTIFAGRVKSITRPDGTLTTYEYQSNTASLETMTELTTYVSEGKPNTAGTAVAEGIRTTTLTNRQGHVMVRRVHDIVAGASGLLMSESLVTQTDEFGRPLVTTYLDGTSETVVYNCCEMESRTDRTGVQTTFGKSPGVTSQNSLGLIWKEKIEGRDVVRTRTGPDSVEVEMSRLEQNPAGEIISSVIPSTGKTTRSLQHAATESIQTTTNPDGGVEVRKTWPDGSAKSLTGTASFPKRYEHGVNTDGTRWEKVIALASNGADTAEWTKVTYDLVGRIKTTERPGSATASRHYNNKNQLVKTVDADGVTTLLTYDDRGRLYRAALDMDRDGVMDLDGTDRITEVTSSVTTRTGGRVVRRASVKVWTTLNDANATEVVTTTDEAVDGLDVWTLAGNLETHTQTAYAGGGGDWTRTTTYADGSTAKDTYVDGRLFSEERRGAGNTLIEGTTYDYDARGRVKQLVDARGGITDITYGTGDRVQTVTGPSPGDGNPRPVLTYGYDAAGRVNTVADVAGGVSTTVFNLNGTVQSIGGNREYAISYTYTSQGRLETMTTATGTTTWEYHSGSGLPWKKYQAGVLAWTQTHSAAGRLATSTNARNITTTYGRDNAGVLSGKDFSDATADISYTYNRLGRLHTATRSGTTRTLSRNVWGQKTSETWAGGDLDGLSLTHDRDALGRRDGLTVTHGAQTLAAQDFTHDGASRLATVADGADALATYAYVTGSSLVDSVTYAHQTQTKATVDHQHNLAGRLEKIRTLNAASQVIVGADYLHDSLDRRTRLTREDGSRWDWGYSNVGSVTTASNAFADGTAHPQRQYSYTFDGIGNRLTATRGGQTETYSPDARNRYTQRTVPGTARVEGEAQSAARVLVNGVVASRKGTAFWRQWSVVNSSSAVWEKSRTVAGQPGGGAGGADALQVTEGHLFVPRTPESFDHDADGNVSLDGRWTYTWDGENRLARAETRADLPAGVPRLRLDFSYDDSGRRILKRRSVPGTTAGTWVEQLRTRFLYDGWNLVAEQESATGGSAWTLKRTYAWGTDVSGGVSGAGGVGGLLFATVHGGAGGPQRFLPGYDGNGNVIAWVEAATGMVSVSMEYDSFGGLLAVKPRALASAAAAIEIPIGFSTKYRDVETGLLHYGFRDYSPVLGRWLSADPLGEAGGVNLYGMVDNDPVNWVDVLGLEAVAVYPHSTTDATLVSGGVVYLKDAQGDYRPVDGSVPLDGQTLAMAGSSNPWGETSASGRLAIAGMDAIMTWGDTLLVAPAMGGFAMGRAIYGMSWDDVRELARRWGYIFPALGDKCFWENLARALGMQWDKIKNDPQAQSQLIAAAIAVAVTGGLGNSPLGGKMPGAIPPAAKGTPEFVNLASPQRTTHILTGDATGGGHLFPGGAGKSPFPQSWSADRVMHEISDVATDPLSTFVTGRGGRTIVTGTRDGIDLKVILGSPREGGGIITGFPTNVPRNP
jgi:RHS repeat-associated protein